MTLGDRDKIGHVRLVENSVNWDLLLKETNGEFNLLGNVSSVNLDFKNVCLLLSQSDLSDLGVGNNSYDRAILLDSVQVAIDVLFRLSVFLGIFGESLLLGLVPSLVEASLEFFAKMGSPDSGQSS